MPCSHLYTRPSTAVLKIIRWRTGSQCNWRRMVVMLSVFLAGLPARLGFLQSLHIRTTVAGNPCVSQAFYYISVCSTSGSCRVGSGQGLIFLKNVQARMMEGSKVPSEAWRREAPEGRGGGVWEGAP